MGRPPGSRNKPKDQAMPTKTASSELTVIDHAPAPKSVIGDMANRYGMEPPAFEAALRATVVPKDVSAAQFAAFLLVAKEYNLNPLTKEIYAFPSRGGGIVPIVSVDGWVNLVNAQGQCDGFSFEMEHDGDKLISCTCSMFRKDRTHPVVVTEYYSECVRQTDPWKMKHRMLRHKALIQAARYAFGFSGIYDEDEGAKIAEIDPNRDAAPPRTVAVAEPAQIEHQPDPEQPRDGTPPRRTAKPAEAKPEPKQDPISSGPMRAAPKDEGPKDRPPEPFRVPGTGHTFETWADQYVDLLKTSTDTAAVYKWIDVNTKPFSPGDGHPMEPGPLDRLSKGKPSVYAKVKKATEDTMQALRDAQQKAADKAAKKSSPAPTEMDAPAGDMDGPGETHQDPDVPQNPEDVLKWIEATLAAITEPEDLENIWVEKCEPKLEGMFPPDQDEANGIYRKHEKRLAP